MIKPLARLGNIYKVRPAAKLEKTETPSMDSLPGIHTNFNIDSFCTILDVREASHPLIDRYAGNVDFLQRLCFGEAKLDRLKKLTVKF